MKTLTIDDCRNFDGMIARNYEMGILALEKAGPWDLLYIDHDLGLGKSGYDVMCWLEKNPQYAPKKIICVSSNPPGRKRIEFVIKKILDVT